MKIRFCRRNLNRLSKPAYRRLKDEPGLELRKSDCLGSCRLCRERCFAVVKGRVVHAGKPKKLARRVLEQVEKERLI
ncbi:DUF1450 domain-containing protein [Paenibacillus albicereus]|uniref:DUF1450 domain-containing protein n=1 Tax=Paenibacillus albicereus TaxID=2726185 RepID=A0A6H2GWW1_9BACL|nr:DUF1450 domain-containing protein [Paenibacillus albicereus]QJC51914.1 DUF1450 domain-containing protein [Paenibacillus albicereus]